ncbi:MAG: hypothetical protein FDZ75_08950, partial [Actinobacteria bacterium]
MAEHATASSRPWWRMRRTYAALLAAGFVLLALGLAALWFYAQGGGPLSPRLAFLAPALTDPLAASDSQETVLRAVRLAGIERAVVG